MIRKYLLPLLFVAIAAAVAACGSSGGDAPPDDANTFLAFASTFQDYRSWESFTLSSDAIANSPHTSGQRVVYLKPRPPHGATSFPLATVIVKEFADQAKIFAMVKRGGDFNATGAHGWEWFELTRADSGAVAISWRGVGPPAGEQYGGDPNGGCNGCHGTAQSNDYVKDAPLTLSNF